MRTVATLLLLNPRRLYREFLLMYPFIPCAFPRPKTPLSRGTQPLVYIHPITARLGVPAQASLVCGGVGW
jgi:hypothetical protein